MEREHIALSLYVHVSPMKNSRCNFSDTKQATIDAWGGGTGDLGIISSTAVNICINAQ